MNVWHHLSEWDIPSFALRVALGGVAVSAVVLLTVLMLRRRSEPLRYGVLFAGVILLLAVPALVALGQRFQDAIVTAAPEEVEIVRVPMEMLDEFLNRPAVDAPAETETRPAFGPIVIGSLLAIWLLGTFLGITRLLFGLWKQRRALIGPAWRPAFWTDELQTQLAQKLGLRQFPDVRVSPAAPMPMVMGILRPTIVLPEPAPANWQQPQWEAVLLHEAAHIARRDHWAALAQQLAVVLFWWCPLVYILARRLNELRESICDDCALQGQCDHIAYAELLVDSAERFLDVKSVPVPLGLLESARVGLEARVLRLLEKERKPMIQLSLPGKLLSAGFLVAACLLTTAATAFSQAQAQPAKKVQIKIIVDGKEIDLCDLAILQQVQPTQKKDLDGKEVEVLKIKVEKKGEAAKGVTFSPDGKLLIKTDGQTVTVIDVATGKLIAKHGDASAGTFEAYSWIGKSDPRIEELVKKAEAIKPGSGAEIRKALQAGVQSGMRTYQVRPVPPVPPIAYAPAVPATAGWKVMEHGGKKIIILSIEDGKVQQLHDLDLKKLLEKMHQNIEVDLQKKGLFKSTISKTHEPEFKSAITAPKSAEKKAAPTPAAADLEALSRQLERINAELRDLRKRLDETKK